MEKIVQVIPARKAGAGDGEQGAAGGGHSEEYTATEMWESDAWIRMVLGYMIAGELEYRVGFLDGSEVRVMISFTA